MIFEFAKREYDVVLVDTYENNLITGTIETEKDSFLLFMIPFDKNWELYVDGKEAQLQQVDYGFMGSRIAAGNHAIKLDYVPDSNAIPVYISIVGIILLAGYILLLKKKSRG